MRVIGIIGIFMGACMYLFLWPVCALMLSGFLFHLAKKAMPACTETYCALARSFVESLGSTEVVSIAILILLIFVISLFSSKIQNRFARFLLNVHKYACLIAPGFVGGEGFGLPAPFLVGVVASGFNVKSLLGHFTYFPLVWLLIFFLAPLFHMMFDSKKLADNLK